MKKGSYQLTGEMMMWIGSRLIITLIVIFVALFIVSLALNRNFNVKDVDSDLTMRKLYYSSNCFAFEDKNVHPGMIDLSKFTEERLTNCVDEDISIKVELKKLNKIISTKSYKSEYDLCLVQNKKNRCFFTTRQYVLINEDNKIKQGDILDIRMILR
tara:strand:- start:1164 stop:1634 length:471 start_codon:yes stop_codon:yes gene_type:complete